MRTSLKLRCCCFAPLQQQQQQAGNAAEEQQPTSQLVEPKPGFCIKTQTDKYASFAFPSYSRQAIPRIPPHPPTITLITACAPLLCHRRSFTRTVTPTPYARNQRPIICQGTTRCSSMCAIQNYFPTLQNCPIKSSRTRSPRGITQSTGSR